MGGRACGSYWYVSYTIRMEEVSGCIYVNFKGLSAFFSVRNTLAYWTEPGESLRPLASNHYIFQQYRCSPWDFWAKLCWWISVVRSCLCIMLSSSLFLSNQDLSPRVLEVVWNMFHTFIFWYEDCNHLIDWYQALWAPSWPPNTSQWFISLSP